MAGNESSLLTVAALAWAAKRFATNYCGGCTNYAREG